MKRIGIIILFLLAFTLTPQAQQRRKPAAKKTVVTRKTSKTTTKKSKTSKNSRNRKTKKTSKSTKSSTTVQALRKQRSQIQQQIKEQERRLASSQQDVKRHLQNLMILNTEIAGKRRTIDTIRHEITDLEAEIARMNAQLVKLQKRLADCKEKYVKSMRYLHRNRSSQSQLMFIFSADNLTQMFRRLRFMREYAAYQHVQGDEIKAQQEAVNKKLKEISLAKDQKKRLLAKGERERVALEGKQVEQQHVVKTLQEEQKTIQNIIAQQKKKDAALNAQIDRLIAEEVARQKARAAAEAKRRAEAAAARQRELAEAKAREEKARAEAMAAKNKKDRAQAERRVREAEEKRVAVERKAESMPMIMPSEDLRISGNFESNRGRLPMPITGAYRIVSHFGQYNVEGLRNVTLDNKGINIKGESGAQARSIFDGEVSGVFSFSGTMVVMVRHGSYISVYCNLASVNVSRGQRVSTRQALGRVGTDNILQFQLRRETTKLNPESWLGR